VASIYRPTYTDRATGQKKKLAKWYGKYRDAAGVLVRAPLSENKQAAQQMLANLVKQAELERAGVVDPFARHSKRPLIEHLDEWEAELRSGDCTAAGVSLRVGRARRLIVGCGFAFIADISGSEAEKWLGRLREDGIALRCGRGKRQQRGASVQTSNFYLAAAKAFAQWLVDDGRAQRNPLARLSGGNPNLDRRHVRRDMTDDEFASLFASTLTRRRLHGLSGPDRAMLYLAAVYTGLRASELANLEPMSIDFETATMTVEAAYSKHRRQDVLPLHPDFLERLRPWLASKPAGLRLWPGKWASGRHAAKMLARDMTTAGLSCRGEDGVSDFHSLRVVFISRLVRAGVRPKEAQALARHSTITLTMDRYAKLHLHDVRAALDMVPPIEPKRENNGQDKAG
jgi:integrase/recombinase XerD